MNIKVINVADLKDPNDPDGRTYREVNLSLEHSIPIGSLVELDDGVRLWVVYHSRDCDGTPLYELSPEKDDTYLDRSGFKNRKWFGGFCYESLKVIKCEDLA